VNGRLIGIAAAVSRIDPGGYISGHAALALRGLTDQDIADWWSISPQRQSDIRYGRTDVHFVCSPDRAAGGERGTVTVAGEPATVGTPSQAILDELRFAPERLDWIATARVLAGAIERRVVTPEALAATFARDRSPSSAVARRLGFILEAVGASVPQAIFDASRATHDITVAPGGDKKIERWRLVAPVSAQEIRRGIQ
jgi:hypothetical protein